MVRRQVRIPLHHLHRFPAARLRQGYRVARIAELLGKKPSMQ